MNSGGVSPDPKIEKGLRVVPVRAARPVPPPQPSLHPPPAADRDQGPPVRPNRAISASASAPIDSQADFDRMMARIDQMEQARSAAAKPRRRIRLFLLCLPLTLVHSVLAFFLLRAVGWTGSGGLQRFLLLAATVLGLYLLNVGLFAVIAALPRLRRD